MTNTSCNISQQFQESITAQIVTNGAGLLALAFGGFKLRQLCKASTLPGRLFFLKNALKNFSVALPSAIGTTLLVGGMVLKFNKKTPEPPKPSLGVFEQLKKDYAHRGLKVEAYVFASETIMYKLHGRAKILLAGQDKLIFILGTPNNGTRGLHRHLMATKSEDGLGIDTNKIYFNVGDACFKEIAKGAIFFCFEGHAIDKEMKFLADSRTWGDDCVKNAIVQEVSYHGS